MSKRSHLLAAVAGLAVLAGSAAAGQSRAEPWRDTGLSADRRAEALVRAMTLEEKLSLLHGSMPILMGPARPTEATIAAGYVAGVPRLGIPALKETDAGLGVANLMNWREGDVATALPSGLALAASFDPGLAFRSGAMIGGEARAKGFNVMLAGGVNLVRDPRCGRNFEYPGEDPLLAGVIAGETIRGVQSQKIVSTVKHFALNAQETGRQVLSATIAEGALRESDLLAFQIAIERGDPGSVMCAYNRINGLYACEHPFLLTQVLKRDWGYRGWVMSDWGAVHSTAAAANAGLDQQSGQELDKAVFFGAPLRSAVTSGDVPARRLDDMVRRILRTLIDKGVYDNPALPGPIDYEAHARVAQEAAERGIVLLKNQGGLLPLSDRLARIAVIGGHADIGVLSGGGSSQVRPVGGPSLELPGLNAFSRRTYHPSAPVAALRALLPGATVQFDDGTDPARAAELARSADVAVVVAEQWTTEGADVPDLRLPDGQDALIGAVAAANPRTVVVLETGGPVLMPWLERVPAVLEAWYPGQRGGEAIAAVLLGRAEPSGRLPVTFPQAEAQLPRPEIPRMAAAAQAAAGTYGLTVVPAFDVSYLEGADVGYRWFAAKGHQPLFAFGHGLSYTDFAFSGLSAEGGRNLTVSFDVRNTGARRGIAVPQVYVEMAGSLRLVGWAQLDLQPGESRRARVTVDPRLLAGFDASARKWRIKGGSYQVRVGTSAAETAMTASVKMTGRQLTP
jgi:beta-glucosidase